MERTIEATERWLEHVSLERDVLDLLKRRSCRAIDVTISLGISEADSQELLDSLEKKGRIEAVKSKE